MSYYFWQVTHWMSTSNARKAYYIVLKDGVPLAEDLSLKREGNGDIEY